MTITPPTRVTYRKGDYIQVVGHPTIGNDVCTVETDEGGETVGVRRPHDCHDITIYEVPATDVVLCHVSVAYESGRSGSSMVRHPYALADMSRSAMARVYPSRFASLVERAMIAHYLVANPTSVGTDLADARAWSHLDSGEPMPFDVTDEASMTALVAQATAIIEADLDRIGGAR